MKDTNRRLRIQETDVSVDSHGYPRCLKGESSSPADSPEPKKKQKIKEDVEDMAVCTPSPKFEEEKEKEKESEEDSSDIGLELMSKEKRKRLSKSAAESAPLPGGISDMKMAAKQNMNPEITEVNRNFECGTLGNVKLTYAKNRTKLLN